MAFYVGQRVVCLFDHDIPRDCPKPWPVKGEIYTVSDMQAPNGNLLLGLAEVPESRKNPIWNWGWRSHRFRPVVERKTDISELTAILNGKRIQLPDLVEEEARSSSIKRFAETVGFLCAGWMICFGIALSDFLGWQ